jgi:hypothetical protein
MAEWVQIGEADLEGKYDEIAFISIPHEQFAKRFGISFTENARYGAGPAAVAIIELRSGTQFLLQHDHPQPGVWLLARIDSKVDAQRAELADVLGLSANDYRWIKRTTAGSTPRPANRSNPGAGRPGPFRPVP